jgi:hypothetical protein
MLFVQPHQPDLQQPDVRQPSFVEPRWEWRVFERFPGTFITAVCAVDVTEPKSAETYILSSVSPHNIKIREGQLDVKRLEAVRTGDLELWRPVFRRAFPVQSSELKEVWSAWNVSPPARLRSTYTIDQFLNELVPSIAELRAVPITTQRARFAVLGCRAERAIVRVDGSRWDTLAVEDEDTSKLLRVQRILDHVPPSGVSFPAMLKRIVAGELTR